MSKYAKIDALLVAECGRGPRKFSDLRYNSEISVEATAVATRDSYGFKDGYRVIDRRLQALRKAGKLTFSHANGWSGDCEPKVGVRE